MARHHPLMAAALIGSLAAAACVRTSVEPQPWPGDLPPVGYFERIYEQDERNQSIQTRQQYLTWVIRFYKGWDLYQDGWQSITRDILLSVDGNAGRQRLKAKMESLGKLISGEWAKDDKNRAIRSRELSIWGQALVKSIERSAQEKLINQVSRDVKALLSHELDPIEITLQRYYGSTAGSGES